MELHELTVREAFEKLSKKETTSKELTEAVLDRIKKTDGRIHAFLKVTDDYALASASGADQIIMSESNFPLTGIPYAAKDNIMIKGIQATAGSKILENYKAVYDATAIKKIKNVGSVLVGKTNLDEFAMGSSTENSAFGLTKNPFDLTRVAGGSSGGSAAAVAAGQALFAFGTDTGGSVRQPASFCGVVGLKPTYGRISRYGLVALGSSLDQLGIFAKTVEDVSLVLQIVAGADEFDTTSLPKPVPDYSRFINQDVKGLKIGVPKEYFAEGLNPEVKNVIEAAIKRYQELGAIVEEASLPNSKYALACYYVVLPVEISANLSRYDGIRYGLAVLGEDLSSVYKNTRSKGFGDEPKRRIMIGTYASSAGYSDQYYKKAQAARNLIRDDFAKAFEKFDILLTPTCPNPAFKIGEKASDPLSMYLEDIYTVSLNIAGVPGISIPAGTTKDGLPVGMQLIAPHWQEERLIKAGDAFEKSLNLKLRPQI